MKKALSLILALVMVLSLAACGKEQEGKVPESTAPEASAPGSAAPTADEAEWSGNVQMIVSATAGGGTDMAARTVAQYINEHSDVNITIVNNNDGNGVVGYEMVRTAKPDGGTLLFFHNTMCNKYGCGIYDHNPATDFTVCALASSTEKGGYILLVAADSPIKNLDDFISEAKARPGQLVYGVETGGGAHIQSGMMCQAAGIEVKFVEAGSDSEKLTALVGGSIEAALVNANSAKQYIEAGKVTPLACVSTDEEGSRTSILPDVPSFIEQGVSFTYDLRFFVLAPLDMDPALVNTINRLFTEAAADPEVDKLLTAAGWGMRFADPATSQTELAELQEIHSAVCESLGLKK